MNGVRKAEIADIPAMVDLSEQKRVRYQGYQPLFWKKAEDSRERQAPFFESQLGRADVIALVHQRHDRVDGFVIARLVPAPPVYAAGLTCLIDDYCVSDEAWSGVGNSLLDAAAREAANRGAAQAVVVCGHRDQPKRQSLSDSGYTIASEWWVRPLSSPKEHAMGLYTRPFEAIRAGRKRIEIRLHDEKRQQIALGDQIVFRRLPDGEEQLRVEVLGLRRFETFADLYREISLAEIDCEGWSMDELLSSTYEIYTPEREREYGVLAITIRPLL